MKKLGILAATMALCTSVYASSLAIPWFVDNAAVANGIPGKTNGVTGIIVLKNNTTDDVTASIVYYNAEGTELGPFAPNNTFEIPALASVSFRPVANDPSTTAGGQESDPAGTSIPNRPTTDGKKNGSATISWAGGSSDVQGIVTYFQTATAASGETVTFSYGTLLPPGF